MGHFVPCWGKVASFVVLLQAILFEMFTVFSPHLPSFLWNATKSQVLTYMRRN
jgi:hypothetical protein